MKSCRLVLFLLVVLGGCAAEPFTRARLPELVNPNPSALRDSFRRSVAGQFTSDDTVIIQAPFRDDMAVLAVLHVERDRGAFELAGLNHMGVEMFQIGGDVNSTTVRSAIGPLMEQKQVLQSIGDDTRRMYFNLVPSQSAKVDARSTIVRFSEETPEGKVVYEFGGEPFVLLEKRLDGFFGYKWRVRYYDYAVAPQGAYPRGIVMDNGKYHYRIIVKNREWTTEQQ